MLDQPAGAASRTPSSGARRAVSRSTHPIALRMKNSVSSSIASAYLQNLSKSPPPRRSGRSSASSAERRIQKSSSTAQRSSTAAAADSRSTTDRRPRPPAHRRAPTSVPRGADAPAAACRHARAATSEGRAARPLPCDVRGSGLPKESRRAARRRRGSGPDGAAGRRSRPPGSRARARRSVRGRSSGTTSHGPPAPVCRLSAVRRRSPRRANKYLSQHDPRTAGCDSFTPRSSDATDVSLDAGQAAPGASARHSATTRPGRRVGGRRPSVPSGAHEECSTQPRFPRARAAAASSGPPGAEARWPQARVPVAAAVRLVLPFALACELTADSGWSGTGCSRRRGPAFSVSPTSTATRAPADCRDDRVSPKERSLSIGSPTPSTHSPRARPRCATP